MLFAVLFEKQRKFRIILMFAFVEIIHGKQRRWCRFIDFIKKNVIAFEQLFWVLPITSVQYSWFSCEAFHLSRIRESDMFFFRFVTIDACSNLTHLWNLCNTNYSNQCDLQPVGNGCLPMIFLMSCSGFASWILWSFMSITVIYDCSKVHKLWKIFDKMLYNRKARPSTMLACVQLDDGYHESQNWFPPH